MTFAALTPTIDLFEAILLVILVVVAIPAGTYNVRESWKEKEWAIDDPDPSMRRLGINRYDNARLLFLALLLVLLGNISALTVPSALQWDSGIVDRDFSDVFNAVVQRLIYIGVTLCITYKAVNDAVWRRDTDRRRRQPRTDPKKDAVAAVALGDRLEAAVAQNTALTTEARDRATEAYAEANTVNQKIERLGITAEAERAVEREERGGGPVRG